MTKISLARTSIDHFPSFRFVLEFSQPFKGDFVVCSTSDDRNNSTITFDVSHEYTVVRPWTNNRDARDDRHRAVHFPYLASSSPDAAPNEHVAPYGFTRESNVKGGCTAGGKDGALNPVRTSGCGNE